jgi:hypothetical protein
MSFAPALDVLPTPQRRLWAELADTPRGFVLYGGTAIALRLRHRQSLDFDFFSSEPFAPDTLLREVPYLRGATPLQSSSNTLTCLLSRDGEVAVSFFGGLAFGRVGDPERVGENGILVASLLDLAATKLAAVQHRAESKDYLDLDALLRAGIELPMALGAARAVYGSEFNPLLSLKSLSFFDDGDLGTLTLAIRKRLEQGVRAVDLARLPALVARRGLAPGADG